jgi:hypothetical protein
VASPHEGAKPHSSYVTIEGAAAPSAHVEVSDGGVLAVAISADGDGRFERVLRLGAGRHEIRVQSGGSEASFHIEMAAAATPQSPGRFELLQTGDVILAHDRNSQQDALYQPVYTHAALYIGPDAEGAPLLLEAVSEDNATPRGPVSALPIEESLAWREADRVDIFRLAAGLSNKDRLRVAQWARRTAARGLPFRTAEFGDLYRLWLLWDPKTDKPRDSGEFQQLLGEMRGRLESADAYDCATLVWHAYRDNTAEDIDLASPNRVKFGGAAQRESERLAALLRPLLILPDSFALSGKLRRVE